MATYSEADVLMRKLKPIIDREIETSPIIRSAIKARKAVVQEAPDTEKHTIAVKFLPDLFDKKATALTFPYNPSLSASDLEKGKVVFVFYYQSLSNGVVMQNATWTAGGTGGGSGSAVRSVNGMTGDVKLTASDLGIASWAQAENKPTYSWSEITGKPTIPSADDFVTLDTKQTITGDKTFKSDNGILVEPSANSSIYSTLVPEALLFNWYKDGGAQEQTIYGMNGISHNEGSSSKEYRFPAESGTLALLSDIPTIPSIDEFVTLGTTQTITGKKTFKGDNGILVEPSANSSIYSTLVPEALLFNWYKDGGAQEQTIYGMNGISHNEGSSSKEYRFPAESGTLALLSDIPTIPSIDEFVTLGTTQTITGKKTFKGEFWVMTDNKPIEFHSESGSMLIDVDDFSIGSNKEIELISLGNFDFSSKNGWRINKSYGTEGQVLTSHGEASSPTWETPSGVIGDDFVKKTGDDMTGNLVFSPDGHIELNGYNIKTEINYGSITFNGHHLDFPYKSGTILVEGDLPDLSNYVTIDTQQTIEAEKTFTKSVSFTNLVKVWGEGIMIDNDYDVPTSHIFSDRIERDWENGIKNLYFPYKEGTLLVDTDLENYVTLNTNQTINGQKTFNEKTYFQQRIVVYDDNDIDAVYGGTAITWDGRNTLTFPDKSGTFALLSDVPSTDNFVKKTGDTMTGNIVRLAPIAELSTAAFTVSIANVGNTQYGFNQIRHSGGGLDDYTINLPTKGGTLLLEGDIIADDVYYYAEQPGGGGQVQLSVQSALDEVYRVLKNCVMIEGAQDIKGKKTFLTSIEIKGTGDKLGLIEFSSEKSGGIDNTFDGHAFSGWANGQLHHTVVLPATSGTIARIEDIPDTSNFVTLNTEQLIIAAKHFGLNENNNTTIVNSGVTGRLPQIQSKIQGTQYNLTIPKKSGTILLDTDMSSFVTIDGEQSIGGQKTFSLPIMVGQTEYGPNSIKAFFGTAHQEGKQYTYTFPEKGGQIALTTDIPNLYVQNSGSGNAVTAITASGHTLIVTKGTTFLLKSDLTWGNVTGKPTFADVATSGSYNDLKDKPTFPSTDGFVKKSGDTMTGLLDIKASENVGLMVERSVSSKNVYVALGSDDVRGSGEITIGASGSGVYTKYQENGIVRKATSSSSEYVLTYPTSGGQLALTTDIKTYTLPQATSGALGGIKIGATGLSSKQYAVQLNSSGQAYVSVPWTDNDTHNTAYLYLASSSTATSQTSGSISNPYMNLVDGGSRRTSIQLVGGTGVTVSASGTSSTSRTVTISGFSGNYNDLTNKPSLDSFVTTDTSQTISGEKTFSKAIRIGSTQYSANSISLSPAATFTFPTASGTLAVKESFAKVATSGSYNDLKDKPTFPSTDNFVTLDTNQTITETKIFASNISFQKEIFVAGGVASYQDHAGTPSSTNHLATYLHDSIDRWTSTSSSNHYVYNFPNKSGTFLVDGDLKDFHASSDISLTSDTGNVLLTASGDVRIEAGSQISFDSTGGWQVGGDCGTAGQVLTSHGDTSPPRWETPKSGNIYSAGTGISISLSNIISTKAASSSASGHVTTSSQTFAGRKTFNGGINIPSGATIQLNGSSGTAGYVLTSNGTSSAPSWQAPSVGGVKMQAINDEILNGEEVEYNFGDYYDNFYLSATISATPGSDVSEFYVDAGYGYNPVSLPSSGGVYQSWVNMKFFRIGGSYYFGLNRVDGAYYPFATTGSTIKICLRDKGSTYGIEINGVAFTY